MGLHRRKKDGRNIWRVSGTGKHNWANNVKVDLNGLSPQSLAKQSLALRGLRKQWNKGKKLRPKTANMSVYAKYQKGDPDCLFKICPKDGVDVHYKDFSSFKMVDHSKWEIRDKFMSIN